MLSLPFIVLLGVVSFIGLLVLYFYLRVYCGCWSSSARDTTRRRGKDVVVDVELESYDDGVKKIATLQANLKEDANVEAIITDVQNLLFRCPGLSDVDNRGLIIGVDATPATLGGYCINLSKKLLSYYVIKQADLPWKLDDPNDTGEFEMRNFKFALNVWKEEILLEKKIRIYTDNLAIMGVDCFDKTGHGEKARQVLKQYSVEQGVKVLNMHQMGINKNKNLKDFAQYIQPADDLSRWKINKALNFLQRMYRIDQENVQGTHFVDWSRHQSTKSKLWYNETDRYQQIIKLAQKMV